MGILFGDTVILLVLSAIAWIVFKERPLVNFSLKAFIVSFGTIFIIFSAVFMANSPLSLLFFFGAQDDATASTGISIESIAENITIYIPVLLDENKTVLKMYETPEITGNVSTAIIDTEYGKALMISGSGSGDYLFNWNEVPGNDTDRFVMWLEGMGDVQPGDKLDINKTDDGRTITVSGRTRIYQLNEKGELKFYRVEDIETYGSSEVILFNWNEVPGKDTDRFVMWLEDMGHVKPGDKLDINKTDDGRTITVSGRRTRIYQLNEKGELKFYRVEDIETYGSSEVILFNWNEVPGKDTDRFVMWLEDMGHVKPGEKWDISKTDDGRTITVSGRGTWTYWLNDKGGLEFQGVENNVLSEMFGQGLFFTKEENGQLNIYSGNNNKISIIEKYGILKEDTHTFDEFLKGFTISMSNNTSSEPFIQQSDSKLRKIGVWVYSDSEVEKISFGYSLDPGNRKQREVISMKTEGPVHLRKGWQVVNLSTFIRSWD